MDTLLKLFSGATFKAGLIGFLTLLLLIPIEMVQSLIRERKHNSFSVEREIISKWGNPQTLTGPVIVVPFTYTVIEGKEPKTMYEEAYFLPEELSIKAEMQPEIRYRSIYQVAVYQSDISVRGKFKYPDFSNLNVAPSSIDWENAFVCIGLSDMRGVRNNINLNWNNTALEVNPGADTRIIESGIHAKIPLNQQTDVFNFDFKVNLNGSLSMSFIPAGKTTEVEISAPWASPKFSGAFIPDSRIINADETEGFVANWKVYNYNRNFPQEWSGRQYNIEDSKFGVDLLIPVDHYQKSERSIKYAIIFIALTFFVFFLVEVISGKRIHPLQYLLVSIGLILFYSLLLALAERIGFNMAYLLSSIAITGLITSYSQSIFKEKKQTLMMGAFLVILYTFLYSVLQLEDLALLIGSIGLFVALAVIMYVSRKIDWYKQAEK